jgi:hypothetical protein
MQHGSAEIDFCNTSRARTSVSQNMKILLLWILVVLGWWKSS